MQTKALLLTKADDEAPVNAEVTSVDLPALEDGQVLVDVTYSSLNYKDALVIKGLGGLAESYPHVPGIDMAGVVLDSRDAAFTPGDAVIQTGFFLGERSWGGYAGHAVTQAKHLVKMPAGMDAQKAMIIGTAGFTAMQAIMQMEHNGLNPENGPVMVLGATGGVGSVACAILANLGYEVHGTTGKADQHEWLKSLGVSQVVPRNEHEVEKPRALDRETYAGCVDTVGGHSLACVLPKMAYRGSVACLGLAGGSKLSTTVVPFLLRGVNILGIDSVQCPAELRPGIWARLVTDMPQAMYQAVESTATLQELPTLADSILAGKIKGRTLVDVRAN